VVASFSQVHSKCYLAIKVVRFAVEL